MAINLPIVSKFDDKGIKEAQKQLGGFGSTVAKIGGVIATAFSFQAIGSFVKNSVSAASDLTESVNAVTVAFGKSAEGILKFGESSASALGVSQVSFNNAAVRFSAFAERIVGDGKDVTGFIGDITTRATDFASVFNIDVAEALQVFQSGLAGEAEPLKRFGINLLDSEVKAYAMANGIGEVGKQLTETEKVQARYGLLMEATAKVQGDFANTSDGLANSQRILQANFQNMQATVGNAVVPALAILTTALVPIIEQMGPMLGEALKGLIPAFTEVSRLIPILLQAFMPLIPIVVKIITLFTELVAMVLPLFIELLDAILPALDQVLPLFTEFLKDLIEPLIPALKTLGEAFAPILKAILPVFVELLNVLMPLIVALLNDGLAALIPAITGLITAFVPLLTSTLPILVDLLKNIVIPAIRIVGTVVTQVFGGAVGFISESVGSIIKVMAPFAKKFQDVFVGIRDFVKPIINSILGFIQGMVNGIVDGVNIAIRALNKIRVTVPDWIPGIGGETFGFKIPELSRVAIPRLAEGGIVMPQPGGVIANIAEAGKPEAVIPLDRLDKFGTKKVEYNITVNAGMGTDPITVGKEIVDAIKRYERSSGQVFVGV